MPCPRAPRPPPLRRAFAAGLGLLAPGAAVGAAPARAPAGGDGGETVAEVVVSTGTRSDLPLSDTPIATELITAAQIAATGARTLGGVLDQVPGLSVGRGFAGSGLSIWGLDAAYVLILLDGQPLTGRVDGAIDLDRIPVADIERIEIVKGAGATLYGADAIAGVVNLITRAPARGVAVAGGGRVGRFVSDAGGPVDRTSPLGLPGLSAAPVQTLDGDASVDLGGERLRARTSLSTRAGPALAPPGPGGRPGVATAQDGGVLTTVAQRLHARPGPQARLDGRASYTRRTAGGTTADAAGAVLDHSQDTELVELRVGPDLLLGDRVRLKLTGSFDLMRDQLLTDQRGATALDAHRRTWDRAAELEAAATAAVGGGHVLGAGAELRHERLEADRITPAQVSRHRGAAWLQEAWDLPTARPLTLVAGLRHDRDSLFDDAWSPRAALRVDPAPPLTLRASVGWGYRAPPFKDLHLRFQNPSAGYVVEGNPELRPERARTAHLRADWAALDAGRLDLHAGLFQVGLRDMIQAQLVTAAAAGEPARYSYANVAEAWTRGAEAGALSRPLPWLGLRGDLVLLQTRDLQADRPLSGRAPVTVTGGLHLGAPTTRGAVDLRGSWRADTVFYAGPTGDDPLTSPARTTVDAVASLRLRPGLTLRAGVDNLLDAADPTLDPLPPRWAWVGLDGRLHREPR